MPGRRTGRAPRPARAARRRRAVVVGHRASCGCRRHAVLAGEEAAASGKYGMKPTPSRARRRAGSRLGVAVQEAVRFCTATSGSGRGSAGPPPPRSCVRAKLEQAEPPHLPLGDELGACAPSVSSSGVTPSGGGSRRGRCVGRSRSSEASTRAAHVCARAAGSVAVPPPMSMPNLVATTTRTRGREVRPRNRSLSPGRTCRRCRRR